MRVQRGNISGVFVTGKVYILSKCKFLRLYLFKHIGLRITVGYCEILTAFQHTKEKNNKDFYCMS